MTPAQSGTRQPEDQPSVGRLGQYTLLEKIAQGGMAQVFKAKTVDATGIERLVVIKRILPHISSHPEYVEMLIDEAKIAVHFTHGNIAQIYDLGRVASDYFIAMEYVDGRTFSQIMRALNERHQRLPMDVLLYCFIELCRGLSYIHRKTGPSGKPLGVVHRDVSPQNIILSYAGNIKIIDFGVARADFISGKTEKGVLKGKFAYMSPEQTRGEKIDHRSDIFSTGVMLWEMSVGSRLFKRASNQETIRAVQKAKFDAPSAKRADVPRELDKIVKKALGKSPRARYFDALDMASDLERLLLAINPDFRPVTAAKFLYDLFGPEKDEAVLPAPFFVKTLQAGAKPGVKSVFMSPSRDEDAPEQIPAPPEDEDVPTVREDMDAMTPVVKLPPFRRFSVYQVLAGVAVILIFTIGSYYAFVTHQLNQRATLVFSGIKEAMAVSINGEPRAPENGVLEVKSLAICELRVRLPGYKDFIQQLTPEPREEVQILVEMEPLTPPFGELAVSTDPPGARVTLDGVPRDGVTPLSLGELKAGRSYNVRLELAGYEMIERRVTIAGGKTLSLRQPLKILPATLEIISIPEGAMVFWNGAKVGVTPYRMDKVIPAREFKLRLSLAGYDDVVNNMTLNPGEKREWEAAMTSVKDPPLPAPVAGDEIQPL